MTSRYSLPSYAVYYRLQISLPNSVVCPSQISMTEAVVNVMTSYYKSMNLDKWEALFTQDEDFANALRKIRNWDVRRPYDKTPASSLFAARNRQKPFFGGQRGFKPKGRIQTVGRSPESHATMMTDFDPKDQYFMLEHPDKMWALISSLEMSYNKFISEPLQPPDSEDVVRTLKLW
ncbi:hypothetical protein PSHT_07592 [Puccinia striiformis]|uniref:Uncharacterized protein n=1 Tax=Puccinia striiformis TaxID=27350 RepID=A0A2S4VWJ1_9BASI|nr:hypothetical protein PSHT_07592 [Puccinia striiformis]